MKNLPECCFEIYESKRNETQQSGKEYLSIRRNHHVDQQQVDHNLQLAHDSK